MWPGCYIATSEPVTSDLFVASSVFLQDPQGVVGPLTFAVKLDSPRQAIVLHLQGLWKNSDEEINTVNLLCLSCSDSLITSIMIQCDESEVAQAEKR